MVDHIHTKSPEKGDSSLAVLIYSVLATQKNDTLCASTVEEYVKIIKKGSLSTSKFLLAWKNVL